MSNNILFQPENRFSIDAKPVLESRSDTGSFEGWVSPPPLLPLHFQCRCPSLSLETASVYSHSQPATPVNQPILNTNDHTHMFRSVPDHVLTWSNTSTPHVTDGLSQTFQESYHETSCRQPSNIPATPVRNDNTFNNMTPSMDNAITWNSSDHTPHTFNNHSFMNMEHMPKIEFESKSEPITGLFYNSHNIHGLSDMNESSFSSYARFSHNQSQEQVIIPSQLTPTDLASHCDSSEMGTPELHAGFMSSYASDASEYNDFDVMDCPSSPGYMEDEGTPEHHVIEPESRPSSPIRPIDQVKRSARRNRQRCNIPRSTFNNYNAQVVLEGDFHQDSSGFMRPQSTSTLARKPHGCNYKDSTGQRCSARFERSEHLKRHEGKHSNERLFPCPLPDCGRKIQRGDNAGDHFKTHMKGPPNRRGRRNKFVEWPVLKQRLIQSYTEKASAKAICNLERWIESNPDGEDQRHWLR